MLGDYGTIITGDALTTLRTLPDQSVQCCVTSPPYWGLRDYGVQGQIGLESSPQEYVAALLPIFQEVRRVLRTDGTLWLNVGDSYIGYHGNKRAHGSAAPSDKDGYRENMRATSVGANGLKNKDMAGIPWRLAFALQVDGWYLRCDCIWAKPNPMPESVQDRPTRAHEYLFLLSKSERYYYDHEAVREPSSPSRKGNAKTFRGGGAYTGGRSFDNSSDAIRDSHGNTRQGDTRNRRSVWTVATCPFPDAHFATFPPELVRPCILAGCPAGGVVLDPFFGAGTVGVVCVEEGRRYIGIELNPDYVSMAEQRIAQARPHGPRPLSLLDLGVA